MIYFYHLYQCPYYYAINVCFEGILTHRVARETYCISFNIYPQYYNTIKISYLVWL